MIDLKDIPEDVQWVWCLQWCGYPVGLDTWEKADVIIKANPKYFPWETKYNSIPKEVHDAYFKEKYAEFDKMWDEKREDGFKGVIPSFVEMDKRKDEPSPSAEITFSGIFKMLAKQQEDQRKAEEETHKKNKSLWDKHYKKYGLEYRK